MDDKIQAALLPASAGTAVTFVLMLFEEFFGLPKGQAIATGTLVAVLSGMFVSGLENLEYHKLEREHWEKQEALLIAIRNRLGK